MALTFPKQLPAMTTSPTFRVPALTSTVATKPRPLSSDDSSTVPLASLSGLALSSSSSAWSRIFSRSRSILMPFLAEISCDWYLPPHSSTRKFMLASSSRIFSGLAVGLSILFMAKIMGTPAACAWFIASRVWGITPSSAATTIMTISVIWAPRARMAVNAS
ncbi:MAG: hypothetical protein BWY89_01846 [Bacteroidetes bacterium ADurb.BinA012]|nr:MAG: hypothetical protein BWY89_01846 [Bacteroidetes bacterium ADurb.BinA012]